jgi:hypothetical protein
MSEALERAEKSVRAAETDTSALEIAKLAMELAKLAAQQQAAVPAPHGGCQHGRGNDAGKWLAIGGAVCVGGIGLAFASLAIAIGAVCATACLIVLKTMWEQHQKGRS